MAEKRISIRIIETEGDPVDLDLTKCSNTVNEGSRCREKVIQVGENKNSSDEHNPTTSCPSQCNNESGFIENIYANRTLREIIILFERSLKIMYREKMNHMGMILHLTFGLLVGLLYWNIGNDASKVFNNTGFLFFSMLFLIYASIMLTAMTFFMKVQLEMKVVMREHRNNWYSLEAYCIAKTMADILFHAICPIMYSSTVYWMTGQPPEAVRFLLFTALCTAMALVAQSLGLLIVAATTSLLVVSCTAHVTVIPVLFFSGFFVHFGAIPNYPKSSSYLTYARYGFEGVIISIYGLNRTDLECPGIVCEFQKPEKVLQLLDVEDAQLYVDFIMLGVFFLIFRFATYLMLRYKVKSGC